MRPLVADSLTDIWGFSDGQGLLVRHDQYFFPLLRQGTFLTTVGTALKAEADRIVVALPDRNYPVQYLLAPDEGHGFARPVNNLATIAASEKFLGQYHGRYQESMMSAVAQRLTKINIDPKTVTLAVPSAASK